jgi:hypothetical protein
MGKIMVMVTRKIPFKLTHAFKKKFISYKVGNASFSYFLSAPYRQKAVYRSKYLSKRILCLKTEFGENRSVPKMHYLRYGTMQ